MMEAVIFVDNLRIGGYQRLSLDQAYGLSDLGYSVTLIVLSDKSDWDLYRIEHELIDLKNISVNHLPNSRRILIKHFSYKNKYLTNDVLILSHSLTATFSLRVSRFITHKRYRINTTIHQLPRLTHFTQRARRFFYSQFSDELFCFSDAVEKAWAKQFDFIPAVFLSKFSKKIRTLRNGIYLPRLPVACHESSSFKRPRIIFLGRLAFWKGLSTLDELAVNVRLENFDFLFMVPDDSNAELNQIAKKLEGRAIIITGKSIADYQPWPGDVHVYPANYGNKVKDIESISLNCLEMGAIGIPSLITAGGLDTWPEFKNSSMFVEVDWKNTALVIDQIVSSSLHKNNPGDIEMLRTLISINRQLIEICQTA
jgi:glycosyltransferase involved in cell wall biosynthesis